MMQDKDDIAQTLGISLRQVADLWGWAGLEPEEILARNAFGNLILRDAEDTLWRITPEDLNCAPLGLPTIPWHSKDFNRDWQMAGLVRAAQSRLGPLPQGHAFHMVVPSILGGAYAAENFAAAPLLEVHAFAGGLAREIAHLPDGASVKLTVV